MDGEWLSRYGPYLLCKPTEDDLSRFFALTELARLVRSLRGDTAECGFRDGTGSALIRESLWGTYRYETRHWWIPDAIPVTLAPRRFRFLHIDANALPALDFFYPRLVPGSLTICTNHTLLAEFMLVRFQLETAGLKTGQGVYHKPCLPPVP